MQNVDTKRATKSLISSCSSGVNKAKHASIKTLSLVCGKISFLSTLYRITSPSLSGNCSAAKYNAVSGL